MNKNLKAHRSAISRWLAAIMSIPLALALAMIAGSALAAVGGEFPVSPGTGFHLQKAWVVDRKQDVTVTVTLRTDGTGRFVARFSNGKRLDGDHFYARVMFLDGHGAIIAVGEHRKGLNASYGGKTRTGTEARDFNIGREYAAAVRAVRYEVGHFQARDDAAFWNRIVAAGAKVAQAAGSSKFAITDSSIVPSLTPKSIM